LGTLQGESYLTAPRTKNAEDFPRTKKRRGLSPDKRRRGQENTKNAENEKDFMINRVTIEGLWG